MKIEFFSIFTFFTFVVFPLITHNASAQDYQVTWSNEKVLALDNVDLPDLSPNGTKLLFIKFFQKGPDIWQGNLWVSNSDGTFARNLMYSQKDIDAGITEDITSASWSPDNNTIVYHQLGGFGPDEIKVTTVTASSGGPRFIERSQSEKSFNGWWPDGSKYIFSVGSKTYVSDADGKNKKQFGEYISDVSFAPGATTIVYLQNSKLIFLNPNGVEKYRKQLPVGKKSNPIWTPNGKYIILGKNLYVVATKELIPFLPENVFTYQENGNTYKGPGCITLSKDGKKFAFSIDLEGGNIYQSKIKVLDLTWND